MKYAPSVHKFTIDNREVMFVNQTHDTTSGFAHDTTLFIDNCDVSTATCYYLNRTWECYQYQSVMKKAVRIAHDWYVEDFKRIYMENRGWKKMTTERRKTFDDYVNQKEIIILLDKIAEKLNER